jgi:hypothetical protein
MCFSLVCDDRTLDFAAEANEEAARWITAFKSLLQQVGVMMMMMMVMMMMMMMMVMMTMMLLLLLLLLLMMMMMIMIVRRRRKSRTAFVRFSHLTNDDRLRTRYISFEYMLGAADEAGARGPAAGGRPEGGPGRRGRRRGRTRPHPRGALTFHILWLMPGRHSDR